MPVHWPRERWLTDEAFERAEALERFGREHGLTLLQVALGGLADLPAVASIIAGATRPDQVRTNAEALRTLPPSETLAALRALA
jgi:aryl-alcohol dehydrogenase-like predicted oxidoreductase